MSTKEHNRSRYRQIVVFVSILLNGLFSPAPFIHADPVRQMSINAAALPVQQHGAEQEVSLLNDVQQAHQDCHSAVRNKQKHAHRSFPLKDHDVRSFVFLREDKLSNSCYASPARHPYYSFLSIYYLF